MTISRFSQRVGRSTAAAAAGLALTMSVVLGQAPAARDAIAIPPNALALEGLPQVRIDVTEEGATRRQLGAAEAAKDRLTIKIVDGRFYRAGGEDRPLLVTSSKDFVYLSSNEPGNYVRLRRLDDRLTYIEHVDMPFGSVTFSGDLRIVLEK
jgi:hypothetical protein